MTRTALDTIPSGSMPAVEATRRRVSFATTLNQAFHHYQPKGWDDLSTSEASSCPSTSNKATTATVAANEQQQQQQEEEDCQAPPSPVPSINVSASYPSPYAAAGDGGAGRFYYYAPGTRYSQVRWQ